MVVFARVVEQDGFSAAARALGLPKSNVSRRVTRLEDQLGARLLERTTRKLRLTEIGRIYYEHCRRIAEEVSHAEISVDQLLEAPRGLLRLNASVTTGQQLISPLIAEFMELYPDVQIELFLSNRLIDVVEEGFDIVIRIGNLEDSSLIAKPLGESRFSFFASPSYLSARGEPSDPDDLADHDWLVMSEGHPPAKWLLVGGEEQRTVAAAPRAIVNDFTSLRRIALDGGGIAVMPSYMSDVLERQNRLVRILPGWSLPPVQFHALYPSHRGATPKVRAFLDFATERIRERLTDTEGQTGGNKVI